MTNEEFLKERIHQFDRVVRAICEELGMDYAGVDCDDGSIVRKIKVLKLSARLAGRSTIDTGDCGLCEDLTE